MKPLQMDAYEILICILEFIADNHKKTINAYDYLDEEGENTLQNMKRVIDHLAKNYMIL